MRDCPCGSGNSYDICCDRLISGGVKASSAEELMRSRYTAYADKNIDYIMNTTHPEKVGELKKDELQEWADNTVWERLEIRGSDEENGVVDFIAYFRDNDQTVRHHELAQFKKHEGDWYFFDSQFPKAETVVNSTVKVGRNEKCPCGSGKKYKKCCGKNA